MSTFFPNITHLVNVLDVEPMCYNEHCWWPAHHKLQIRNVFQDAQRATEQNMSRT